MMILIVIAIKIHNWQITAMANDRIEIAREEEQERIYKAYKLKQYEQLRKNLR